MAEMCKWKYREVSPDKKGHTINRYVDYVEKQVEDRRNVTGPFALSSDADQIIGCNDDKAIEEKMNDTDNFDDAIYLKYIDERKGSSGVFSSKGSDPELLKEKLKDHTGVVWLPIVSLKEDEARLYGLDTEAAWIDKGRALAECYRNILGIDENNFNFVAAFHTKAEADRNPNSDAGCQPHLHFMIWEDTPVRSKYKLTEKELDKVHEKTANILSKEYMKQFYEERNKYKENTLDYSKMNVKHLAEDIENLVMDINELTGCIGRLTVGRFEKEFNIASHILDKLEAHQELTEAESHHAIKMRIEDTATAKQAMSNRMYILDTLDDLTAKVMENPEVVYSLDKFRQASDSMRRAQPEDVKDKLFADDVLAIQKEVKNAILNEVKNAEYQNRVASPAAKAMLYEKIEEGSFDYKRTDIDTFDTTTATIATLCKTMDIPESETVEMTELLLYRSLMPEYIARARNNIASVYESFTVNAGCTSNDLYNAMRSIRVPITRAESQFRRSAVEPYNIAARTMIDPIAKIALATENNDNRYTLVDFAERYSGSGYISPVDYYEERYKSLIDDITSTIFGDEPDRDDNERYR